MIRRAFAIGIGVLFGLAISLPAQWAKTYGGRANDRAWSVIQDKDGNFVVAGSTESFGKGKKDMWILNLDADGKILWERTYGDTIYPGEDETNEEAFSIQPTRDGRYIAAGSTDRAVNCFAPDIRYLKLKQNGDMQWQRYALSTRGYVDPEVDYGARESVQCMKQSPDGSFIAVGYSQRIIRRKMEREETELPPEIFALKTDGNGVFKFRRAFYGGKESYASAVAPLPDGGYLIAGRSNGIGMGNFDIWLLKISSSGDIVWQYSYGGTGIDEAHDLALTADGGCVLAGPTTSFGTGGYDAWILKLNNKGKILWQKAYGGPKDDYAHAIRKTKDGGYIVAGSTSSFGSGNLDAWVLKLNKYGSIIWQKTYGGKASDGAWSVEEIKAGGYVVAGKSASFGAGKDDVLVLKVDTNGEIDASCGSFLGTSEAAIIKTKCSPNPTTGRQDNYDDESDCGGAAWFKRITSKASPTIICKKRSRNQE